MSSYRFSLFLSLARFSLRSSAVGTREVEPARPREVSRRGLRRRTLLRVYIRGFLIVARLDRHLSLFATLCLRSKTHLDLDAYRSLQDQYREIRDTIHRVFSRLRSIDRAG